jgi:sensor histidine kinase YesM
MYIDNGRNEVTRVFAPLRLRRAKRKRHAAFQPILFFLLFLTGFYAFANEPARNSISSSSKTAVLLTQWQVTRDQTPGKELQIADDSLWMPLQNLNDSEKYSQGNWLIRTDLFIEDSISDNCVWGLFPKYFITAYEVYWDGMKIAQNGTIGKNRNEEKPGTYNPDITLPHHLMTSGKHTIMMRISHYHDDSQWKWIYSWLLIGPYAAQLTSAYQQRYQSFFICGILLIPFFFNLFLYFARKGRIEHLLFGLFCLIIIADHLTNQLTVFTNLPTTYIHWETFLYRSFTVLANILFPSFLIYTFSFPRKTIMLVILTNLIVFIFFTNFWNIYNVSALMVLITSSIIAFIALLLKREGSIIIFSGLVLTWLAYLYGLSFAGLANIMAICTSVSIARQFAGKEKAERKARLQSIHLENELLKKNINPHFLLNSLTSIIAWLRKDPKTAIKLIEALADEFTLITQISSLKLIPIQQEIDLCRAHLRIMSYRKGAKFTLIARDINEGESVPPMIFHTLIENGFTHGYENKNNGTFTLWRRQSADAVQYSISNDGEWTHGDKKKSGGFGMQYIQARLEESYPGRWKIGTQNNSGCWEVTIEIRNA